MTPRRGRWIGDPKPPDLSRVASVVISGPDGAVVVSAEKFRREHPLTADDYRRRWRLLAPRKSRGRAKAP